MSSSCRLFSFIVFIVFLIIITSNGHYYYCSSSSSSDNLQTGYRFSLPVPVDVDNLFTGRAFIMEAGGDGQQTPDFRVALSVVEEDLDNKKKKLLFSCSLDVFLGEVRVWSSAHFFRFYALRECVLELTNEGDLLLKEQNQTVGWKTGTSGQGVQRLQLLRNGNLVLVDSLNQIKWQSFNFPTDTMLYSQTLNVATRLTSFPTNSTSLSFSFDIERQKIALYLNSAANSNSNSKYPFWEFRPSQNRNLTFIKVSTQGLDIFDDRGKKISQIQSQRLEPIRFLALDNKTGSLGLYYYSTADGNFKAAFRVPNSTCDLPLACRPYEICTLTNVCSSSFINNNNNRSSCNAASRDDVKMVELRKVWSVIRGIPADTNVSSSKDRCAQTCINNCKCAAALYNATSSRGGACFVYEFVRGLKELDLTTPLMATNKLTYMVKLRKEDTTVGKASSSSAFKGWVLALVGATDALVLLLLFLGILYYCCVLSKRRNHSHPTNHPQQ
ncbi:EP1-like glycoprotein 3 [Impatiens glandulifera]|uniref:EP1-like glycoprotein 3 n=1 Tax=Impatiens glandulifera TaxID=253017 RepID=UPI001FB052AB|nr:EP1-like glycoprotein 3 [Impatiens glandulifera]